MSKIYSKSPLTQAVCEFRFKSSKEWDWTIPGLVYQEIQSEFPIKREERAFEVTVTPQMQVLQNAGSALSKLLFLRADEKAMVHVGPDLLGITVLAPYPGWEKFIKLIADQFAVYGKVANPAAFSRIGLRYINQINIPGTTNVELTEYFRYYPHLPEDIDQNHGPFAMRVTHGFADDRDTMNVGIATGPTQSDAMGFILDIDYSLIKYDKVELKYGLHWVEEAHSSVETMFEACLTEKTRQLFGEHK